MPVRSLPASHGPKPDTRWTTADRWMVAGGLALLALLYANLRYATGWLLRPLPPNVVAATAFVGVLAAFGMIALAMRRSGPITGAAMLNLVIGIALVGYKLPMIVARTGTQTVAFAGLAPARHLTVLTVAGSHYEWWAKRGGNYIDVASPAGRATVALPATDAAYAAAQAGERLALPVETGRFGIERIVLSPNVRLSDLRPEQTPPTS